MTKNTSKPLSRADAGNRFTAQTGVTLGDDPAGFFEDLEEQFDSHVVSYPDLPRESAQVQLAAAYVNYLHSKALLADRYDRDDVQAAINVLRECAAFMRASGPSVTSHAHRRKHSCAWLLLLQAFDGAPGLDGAKDAFLRIAPLLDAVHAPIPTAASAGPLLDFAGRGFVIEVHDVLCARPNYKHENVALACAAAGISLGRSGQPDDDGLVDIPPLTKQVDDILRRPPKRKFP
jgi:hypothetical protein